MSDEQLDEVAAQTAIAIYRRNMVPRYYKKMCKRCGGKAHQGRDYLNRVIPCERCVNIPGAKRDWNEYCDNEGRDQWRVKE